MNNKNKPRLYHGSSNKDIKIFEPRRESVRDPNEGPVIFATPDPAYASCFIVKSDNRWSSLSCFGLEDGTNSPWVKVIADRDKYEALDIGGKVYELPNNTFENFPDRDKGIVEWVSKVSVVALETSKTYRSGLEAMIELGVQVFFTDQSFIDQMRKSEDHGLSIIMDLQNKGLSENQKLGKNVVLIG